MVLPRVKFFFKIETRLPEKRFRLAFLKPVFPGRPKPRGGRGEPLHYHHPSPASQHAGGLAGYGGFVRCLKKDIGDYHDVKGVRLEMRAPRFFEVSPQCLDVGKLFGFGLGAHHFKSFLADINCVHFAGVAEPAGKGHGVKPRARPEIGRRHSGERVERIYGDVGFYKHVIEAKVS